MQNTDNNLFQGLNIPEFTEKFSRDDKCREYFSHQKWEKAFNTAIGEPVWIGSDVDIEHIREFQKSTRSRFLKPFLYLLLAFTSK